jgi:predicted component of type VI protein secretion system
MQIMMYLWFEQRSLRESLARDLLALFNLLRPVTAGLGRSGRLRSSRYGTLLLNDGQGSALVVY